MVRLDPGSFGAGGVDWAWAFGFLARRTIAGVEIGTASEYRRLLHAAGGVRVARARLAEGTLQLGFQPAGPRGVARQWAARLFDLDRDITPFQRLARQDRLLGRLITRRPGIRVPQILDPFEAVVRAIVGQLISVAAAHAILGRLVHRFGAVVARPTASIFRCFPRAEDLAGHSVASLCECGLPRSKALALSELATATVSGGINWPAIASLAPDDADRALRTWRGIGPWTAAYVRMRAFGDRDVALAGDVGISHALEALGVPPDSAGALFDRWRPWRSYAMMHLWASLEPEPS